MKPHHQQPPSHYLPLILSVLFIGTSGPLGRLIQLSPVVIICLRSFIALVLVVLIIKVSGKSIFIRNKKQRNFILVSGIFMAGHWLTYFFSLQLSSVAIGMLSLFTYPVITVILEPFYLKTTLKPIQIPVALLALAGIYIMLPSFDIKNQDTLGVLFGLSSAFFYAGRNLILKKHAVGQDELVVISYQLAVVIILTIPLMFFVTFSINEIPAYWHYLLFIGIVTTAMGHSFFVKSLQYFSVSTVSILSNFTPAVGIMLGIVLLHENPTGHTLIGGALILFAAILEVWLGTRRKVKNR